MVSIDWGSQDDLGIDAGRMPLMDHLRELRRRLLAIILIIGAGAVIGWFLYAPIMHLLERPYCDVSPKYRFASSDGRCVLVYHGVLDGFTTRMKVAITAGAVLTGPLWLYQIWAYVTPGLKARERKFTVWFVATSSALFIAGMALAYYALVTGLSVLLTQAGPDVQALLTVNAYLSFVMLMLFVFGASFELPLLIVLANLAGVLPANRLRRSQRISIFGIFAFAAIATPSPDPFSMCLMALPMVALFEIAVGVAIV
ncbi:MAG TPA: twin-arginine translocase subunit TatC, partial [Mycobacteriales bacterium]|nr:twin-arginine translocase subunit TatC [Mycobacteriales bacterium]